MLQVLVLPEQPPVMAYQCLDHIPEVPHQFLLVLPHLVLALPQVELLEQQVGLPQVLQVLPQVLVQQLVFVMQ